MEKQNPLNFQTIGAMAEKVQGAFIVTILDRQNNIYFVREDNPLEIFCYDGFYIYASTPEILCNIEQKSGLNHLETIPTEEGNILKIERNSRCSLGHLHPASAWMEPRYCHLPYWDITEADCYNGGHLMDIARTMGVPEEDVQLLFDYGCCADEIEELLYEPQMLHDLTAEIRCDHYRNPCGVCW